MRLVLVVLLALLCLPLTTRAGSRGSPFTLCEGAATDAESGRRLPIGLLPALAQVESGRPDAAGTVRPWPWTIDVEGQGQFFATKAQAVAAVRALQAAQIRSIDVGCLQVNLLHHPAAFASLEQAFDPTTNARYAARFLDALHGRYGSWQSAIAAYHSETPLLGAAYRARVLAIWHPGDSVRSAGSALFANTRRAAYADFLPSTARYAAFAGCRCVNASGARPACRCD